MMSKNDANQQLAELKLLWVQHRLERFVQIKLCLLEQKMQSKLLELETELLEDVAEIHRELTFLKEL